jgi:hypothetical protein
MRARAPMTRASRRADGGELTSDAMVRMSRTLMMAYTRMCILPPVEKVKVGLCEDMQQVRMLLHVYWCAGVRAKPTRCNTDYGSD